MAEQVSVPKIQSDYSTRGLDYCHFCGLKYNVGARIPRIVVGCGHTFCTSCLSYFLRNNKIKCPICRKMLKGVDTVDKLPLNFNILYEIVTQDSLLASVNFDKCLQQEDLSQNEEIQAYMCQTHDQRIKHFYCSEHPSIFCRECIRELHNQDECFVVDLYEIEKMRKLQEGNIQFNKKQIELRGGKSESYVIHPELPKFENPFKLSDTVKKALFTRSALPKANLEAQEPSENSDPDHLNTAEKQQLKRDLLMMGYDEDSYDQQDAEEVELTEQEKFKRDKMLFAQQLKQDLKYGKSKPQVVANEPEYDEEEYGSDEYEEGEVVRQYVDSEEEEAALQKH